MNLRNYKFILIYIFIINSLIFITLNIFNFSRIFDYTFFVIFIIEGTFIPAYLYKKMSNKFNILKGLIAVLLICFIPFLLGLISYLFFICNDYETLLFFNYYIIWGLLTILVSYFTEYYIIIFLKK